MNESHFDPKSLKRTLKIDAISVGIPSGAADDFINAAIKSVEKSLSSKTQITNGDLERAVAKELQKYNADFAYVYKNRDKIV